jgi:hypothetical protein
MPLDPTHEDEVYMALMAAKEYLASGHQPVLRPLNCSGCTTLYLVVKGMEAYHKRVGLPV